jgi:60 kDa SS-A/Ro ribonucleoprotein
MNYTTFSTRKTPQSEAIPGKNMIQNSAGGFAFAIDDWKRLDRFLILGNEGGTYYASEQKLTRENAECVIRCINADGIRTVNRIAEISNSGRAPKNDPALFALAMCAGLGNPDTKKTAFNALPQIARIGTHLFHFATYVEQFRGWGRGLSNAVKNWYNSKEIDNLAYQVIKYQSRDNWSHRDLLRLSHPKTDDPRRNAIYKWIVDVDTEIIEGLHEQIIAFESAKKAQTEKEIIQLIQNYNLPRECIPTQFLNSPAVWETLLDKMSLEAMIRNLAKMTSIELIKPFSSATNKIADNLLNADYIHKSRLHPFKILTALKIYQQGHGQKGRLIWNSVSQIVDALNEAFYLAFDNVESINKNYLLAIDISGSMTWSENYLKQCGNMQAREGAAAMALVTANVEKNHIITVFSDSLLPVTLSPRQRLDDVIRIISNMFAGGTDCALPMIWALENNLSVDIFIIYTDNETGYGDIHPCQALQEYRQKMNILAKLIVVGMTATQFSIADPSDSGMLDIVGFDIATPTIISDFCVS